MDRESRDQQFSPFWRIRNTSIRGETDELYVLERINPSLELSFVLELLKAT